MQVLDEEEINQVSGGGGLSPQKAAIIAMLSTVGGIGLIIGIGGMLAGCPLLIAIGCGASFTSIIGSVIYTVS